ncbi:hypothetical protein [Halobellus rubicundus]|uniref:Minor tail protein n=1 Tax=Halobellus rubicundus TaxID=2996466 RepID=A0ABD5MHI0_9EURY
MATTNEQVRRRYEDGKYLNDGAVENTDTDSPANGADTVVTEDTDVHIVDTDGTNTVDLSNIEAAGRTVRIVHNGGANTPTVTFDAADFVGSAPGDLTSAGATVTVQNINGNADGWVEVSTGSA